MVMVIATIEPSLPAAYCRMALVPFAGACPGSYVDFSMFCCHVPINSFAPDEGLCADRIGAHTSIVTTPTITKVRFIQTSSLGNSYRGQLGNFRCFSENS